MKNRAINSVVVLAAALGGVSVWRAVGAETPPGATPPKVADKAQPYVPANTAPAPKPLSEAVKHGIGYLVEQQGADGGWGQGGGWRVGGQGGRVEGADVKDPPDVGNTAVALLALVRAGNTPKEGPYAKNVARAVAFLCARIEKADDKSLDITDVKGTQLQSKIGPYVDTFLASMVLTELKGKMGDEASEKRTVAALTKVIRKMEKNQREDGTFAGNEGWAPVLSQGLANKGFARAEQEGLALNEKTIRRVQDQVAANYDTEGKTFKPAGAGAAGAPGAVASVALAGRGGVAAVARAPASSVAAPSDAGVPIYTAGAYLTNAADVTNARQRAAKKAHEVLDRKDASKQERDKAAATLNEVAQAEKLRAEATDGVLKQLNRPEFVQGFGSNGGEEFLSYLNIGEALLLKGGDDWKKWDKTMTDSLVRVQDKGGSWSGQHCITGKTFCTASALLVLMTDRAPVPVAKDKPGK
jgi:hypothetical protein